MERIEQLRKELSELEGQPQPGSTPDPENKLDPPATPEEIKEYGGDPKEFARNVQVSRWIREINEELSREYRVVDGRMVHVD